ncbi:MAG: metallophosphoesterase family protein [Aeropyrum sp.]|nr:metallophosphoesterase family protein [Aeropyrum sp.]MCE4616519.1 metallophosphoesterase family protein [Aeropyrum sp.]
MEIVRWLVRDANCLGLDIVVVTGDFECTMVVEEILRCPSNNIIAVTGNVDHAGIRRALLDAGVLADGRTLSVKGLVMAGVGGMDPANSVRMLAKRIPSEGIDILLSHHPPHGILDITILGARAGLWELKELVDKLEPSAHLFGHIHESRGVERHGRTVFVNPGPLEQGFYAVISLEGGVARATLGRLGSG